MQPWFQICSDSSLTNRDVVIGKLSDIRCVARVIPNSLGVNLLPACVALNITSALFIEVSNW